MSVVSTLEEHSRTDLLRLLTAGSVDDGKSTLIGRLLYDSKGVFEDHLRSLEKDSARVGSAGEGIDYSLLLDGLRSEREQGITIDVAYRYFSTPRRKFIIADTPGHEQYTRNMATGASTANLAILLVDAQHGVVDQTRRHSFIASLLGIRHILVAVNKMDLVDYSEEVFEKIRSDFSDFAARLEIRDVHFIPISALQGDNVVVKGENMPWYSGSTLLHHIETVHIASDRNFIDLRFPVQYVLRQSGDFRGYCGTVASGVLRPGDEVAILPSGTHTRVKAVHSFDGELEEAFPPMAVTVTLEDQVDASRGDMLVHPGNVPRQTDELEAMVVWMGEEPMPVGKGYLIKHGTATVRAEIQALRYRVNVNTLHREESDQLELNEIGRVQLTSARKLALDPYRSNRSLGSFILIDPISNVTVGAGMLLDRRTEEQAQRDDTAAAIARHLERHESKVSLEERTERLGHSPACVWLTGLPRSGKSTLGYALERRLFDEGVTAHVLDGGNLRQGISENLGFRALERAEQSRRAAHVAALSSRVGLVTIVALVSPYREDRDRAREIVGAENFVEVHLDVPVEVCEERDTDGLYDRARAGEIEMFSGISAPYEAPEAPELRLDTSSRDVDSCVDEIVALLRQRGVLGV